MRGDWVLTLSGGQEAGGGRANPFSAELWGAPLAGGTAVRIARYLDRDELGAVPTNNLGRQLSADGRRIVLSIGDTTGTRRFGLVLVDLERGTASTLARDDGADLIRPALSPDGLKVAYVRKLADGTDDGLWLTNADGSGARRLRAGVPGLFTWTFGWTPDSRRLAFDQVGSSASYVLLDVASGSVSAASGFTTLLYGETFDWRAGSPSFVAGFADAPFNGEYRIVVADRPDAPQRVLVRESNRFLIVGVPRWHPTTDEILYRRLIGVARIEFYVVRASGGEPTRVPLSVRPYVADWTPDGQSIAYLSQDSSGYAFDGVSVRIAARDGSADRELFATPSGGLMGLVTVRYPP